MKALILGLDAACPEILLESEDLVNFRRLMEVGFYGRIESVHPPITVPAWMCMATSQDPGSLGVYGFRNRPDRDYSRLAYVDSRSFKAMTIWDQFAREGRKSVIVGVPPSYPPRKVNGVCVGCFLTPDPRSNDFVFPSEWQKRIREIEPDYQVDVKGFRTSDKRWLRDAIFSLSRRQFSVVRRLMQDVDWDFFQFVDIGLDRIQHGFWRFHDPLHRFHDPDNPFKTVIRDYYRHLDEELGRILGLLGDDVAVFVTSDHGARRLDGAFCVNEWLIREGYLKLERYPETPTPLADLSVDWSKTRAWSEGGYYARVYLNVKGREPEGTIAPADYEAIREELAEKLRDTRDPEGRPLGTVVQKPEEIYRSVHGVAPDLLVYFGGLAWRSAGTIGHQRIHLEENDTGPDDANHAQHGAFILAAEGLSEAGERDGATILDVAPTLLELAGCDIPDTMQGRSLLSAPRRVNREGTDTEEVRDRLRGLGYIE